MTFDGDSLHAGKCPQVGLKASASK